jgi:hypothetical protein
VGVQLINVLADEKCFDAVTRQESQRFLKDVELSQRWKFVKHGQKAVLVSCFTQSGFKGQSRCRDADHHVHQHANQRSEDVAQKAAKTAPKLIDFKQRTFPEGFAKWSGVSFLSLRQAA